MKTAGTTFPPCGLECNIGNEIDWQGQEGTAGCKVKN